MNSANADERRGELSLACILALDVQLVRATITRGSGPICSRVGAPPRMSSMPQPHLVRCVIRDTPARRARLHDARVPTAGDLLVTTPTNTDRTPYTCTLVLPCRPSRPEPALLLPQARQPRHTAPWRVPRVHTHNSPAHTNLYHAKLSSNKHPLSLTWRLSRPTIALVLQGRRGAPSPSFRGKKGQCAYSPHSKHCPLFRLRPRRLDPEAVLLVSSPTTLRSSSPSPPLLCRLSLPPTPRCAPPWRLRSLFYSRRRTSHCALVR